MKITQNAARRGPESAAPDVTQLAARLSNIETRFASLEHIPPSALAADELIQAIEARLAEHARAAEGTRGQFQDALVALERKLAGDIRAQQQDLVGLHREFAAAVAHIVEEQVATQLEARFVGFEQTIDAAVEARLDEVRGQLAIKEQELEGLRQRVAESDRNVLEIILGMGSLCRQMAERLHLTEPVRQDSETQAPPETGETAARSPGFGQSQSEGGSWRIPLVSSFLALAAGGLLILHYL
jgi:hypothetical protein